VQRKATFIDQVMRGEISERSLDDVGDAALSYAEVKALATGNPLIMERAGVEGDLARLERQLRSVSPAGLIARLEHRLGLLEQRAGEALDAAKLAESEAAKAAARIGSPFEQLGRIGVLRSRLTEIDAALSELEVERPQWPSRRPEGSALVTQPTTSTSAPKPLTSPLAPPPTSSSRHAATGIWVCRPPTG
jgi:hypothetical protein